MNCHDFENRLEDFLDGTLPEREMARSAGHVAECGRCRRIVALMSNELDLPAVESPPDLVSGILERTTGSPCDRAGLLLCDYVDGELDGVDRELVYSHLAGCGECNSLAESLARLAVDLPAMANLQPDARFLDDILARTVSARAGERTLWTRLTDACAAAVMRPRFALEGAYVGTAVLLLLVATPFSPFRDLPSTALAAMSQAPRVVADGGIRPVAELGELVADYGQQAWEATEGKLLSSVKSVREGAGERARRAGEKTRDIRHAGEEFGEKLLDGDIHGAWNRLRSPGPRESLEDTENNPPDGGEPRSTQ